MNIRTLIIATSLVFAGSMTEGSFKVALVNREFSRVGIALKAALTAATVIAPTVWTYRYMYQPNNNAYIKTMRRNQLRQDGSTIRYHRENHKRDVAFTAATTAASSLHRNSQSQQPGDPQPTTADAVAKATAETVRETANFDRDQRLAYHEARERIRNRPDRDYFVSKMWWNALGWSSLVGAGTGALTIPVALSALR